MMSVNIEEEHVREDAGMGSLADVSCHACELGSMREVYGGSPERWQLIDRVILKRLGRRVDVEVHPSFCH